MELKYFLIPFIGAIIGWLTNVLAIKLIFRPFKPIRIPILNIKFQGLIPKRREEIAVTIGKLIEEQLISVDDVIDSINSQEAKQKIVNCLIPVLKNNFHSRLPGFIPGSIKRTATNLFEEILKKETPDMVGKISSDIINNFKNEIKFGPIVKNKLLAYDVAGLEQLVLTIASRELKHIEILGAVLGFLIGMLQSIIVYFS